MVSITMHHPLQEEISIGEGLLCKTLGENVNSFLCKWEILQGYHLIMHQDLDVVHVYLNVFGILYIHWIYADLD